MDKVENTRILGLWRLTLWKFSVMTPCNLVGGHMFRRKYFFHLQRLRQMQYVIQKRRYPLNRVHGALTRKIII
jgi:hypothetical protein